MCYIVLYLQYFHDSCLLNSRDTIYQIFHSSETFPDMIIVLPNGNWQPYWYIPFEKYLVDWKIIIVQTFESKWKTDGGDAAVVIWARTEWHWRSEVKDTPNDNSLPAKPGYF